MKPTLQRTVCYIFLVVWKLTPHVFVYIKLYKHVSNAVTISVWVLHRYPQDKFWINEVSLNYVRLWNELHVLWNESLFFMNLLFCLVNAPVCGRFKFGYHRLVWFVHKVSLLITTFRRFPSLSSSVKYLSCETQKRLNNEANSAENCMLYLFSRLEIDTTCICLH